MRGCYVYVIAESGENGNVKIGIAADPVGRLAQLQTGNPNELSLHRKYLCPTREIAQVAEKLTHERLADHRLNGEWFSCGIDDARMYARHYWILSGGFVPDAEVMA